MYQEAPSLDIDGHIFHLELNWVYPRWNTCPIIQIKYLEGARLYLSPGNLYQGAPSLEDTGMLMGMGKRASSMVEPFRPSRNPRWNRHHRIQRGEPWQKETAAEAMKTRRDEMEEMEREALMQEEEMVELMEKRSGLTLPTPNVEDAGMLMGMGKRSLQSNLNKIFDLYCFFFITTNRTTGNGEFALEGGLSR